MNSPFLSAALAEARRAELLRQAAEYRRAHAASADGTPTERRRRRALSRAPHIPADRASRLRRSEAPAAAGPCDALEGGIVVPDGMPWASGGRPAPATRSRGALWPVHVLGVHRREHGGHAPGDQARECPVGSHHGDKRPPPARGVPDWARAPARARRPRDEAALVTSRQGAPSPEVPAGSSAGE